MNKEHSIRGRKRCVDHDAVVAYAKANPSMYQADIAAHFGTSQSRVSCILRSAGVGGIQRGRPLKRRPGQDDEQYRWEQILHEHGLGMERGGRLNNERLLYGYDPRLGRFGDSSATSNAGT